MHLTFLVPLLSQQTYSLMFLSKTATLVSMSALGVYLSLSGALTTWLLSFSTNGTRNMAQTLFCRREKEFILWSMTKGLFQNMHYFVTKYLKSFQK